MYQLLHRVIGLRYLRHPKVDRISIWEAVGQELPRKPPQQEAAYTPATSVASLVSKQARQVIPTPCLLILFLYLKNAYP